jgi:hypothetical protein
MRNIATTYYAKTEFLADRLEGVTITNAPDTSQPHDSRERIFLDPIG